MTNCKKNKHIGQCHECKYFYPVFESAKCDFTGYTFTKKINYCTRFGHEIRNTKTKVCGSGFKLANEDNIQRRSTINDWIIPIKGVAESLHRFGLTSIR